MIRRAGERYRTEQPGIVSWHCFSAGAHYDPAAVSFGDLIGVDEHNVEPGAGFDWHAHRGTLIASWVLAGALRHQDDRGADLVVENGALVEQDATSGLRHRETCASVVPLRFVQMTAVSGRFEVWHSTRSRTATQWHLFVARGEWTVAGDVLRDGDSTAGYARVSATGRGELLVWTAQ